MLTGYLAVIALAITFAVIMAIGQGLYWAYVSRKEAERQELARRLGNMTQEEAESLFRERARDALANGLGALGDHLTNILLESEIDMTVSGLVGRMVGIGALVSLVLFFVVGIPAVAAGAVASIIPYFYVRNRAAARARKLLEQLPDSLDLMARSLQAGLGLADAFKLVAEEMAYPVAAEFGRVFEEVRFGREYRESLGNMLDRNPSVFELRIFVSSVLLQRETGGNLIEILTTISQTIRQRFLFQAKVAALTAEARFSAMILGGLPLAVAVLITVVRPTYLSPLFSDPFGNIALVYFFCSYSLGSFIMYRVSQVEV